jgi:hypothetical protein
MARALDDLDAQEGASAGTLEDIVDGGDHLLSRLERTPARALAKTQDLEASGINDVLARLLVALPLQRASKP